MSNVGEVERFFDTVAPRYDEIVGGNGWPANDLLREELAGVQAASVLDLGAGTGRTCEAILEETSRGCVVVVDVSTEMLKRLRERYCRQPRLVIATMAVDQFLADIYAKINSAETRRQLHDRSNKGPGQIAPRHDVGQFLGKPPRRLDLVTAIGLLHFLPDSRPTMAGVAGVLNSSGRFIFTYDPFIPGHPIHGEKQTTYDVTVYRSAPDDIENALHRSGLEVVSDRPFVPQPNGNTAYQNRFVVARKCSQVLYS
jgi:predicted TPR repeat methyltransferase